MDGSELLSAMYLPDVPVEQPTKFLARRQPQDSQGHWSCAPGLLARANEVIASQRFCRSAECLLLAQSGHPDTLNQCPLLGVKRTLTGRAPMSAFDPNRTQAAFLISIKLRRGQIDLVL